MSYQPQPNNPYGYNVRVDEHGTIHDTGISFCSFFNYLLASLGYNPNCTNANAAESGMSKNQIGFNDQTIRQAFVRKVFTLVTIMVGYVL